MKSTLTRLLFLLLITTNSACGQEWVGKYVSEIGFNNADSLVSSLQAEMKQRVGQEPPKLSFFSLGESEPQSLKSFEGKIVLLMFWSINCSGCKMQLDAFKELDEKYPDRKLTFLNLSLNSKSSLKEFQKENQIPGVIAPVHKSQLKNLSNS